MLILVRNDGKHIEPLGQSSEMLVKVLDRTGRHVSVIAITEDSNSNGITIAVEPPLVEHAKIVMRDGEEVIELTTADVLARQAAMAAHEAGPEETATRGET